MIVVWINKANWKKPGPITYMGLLNARAFAELGYESHYFVSHGDESDTADDLREFYGLENHPLLHIHRVPRPSRWREAFGRRIYREALDFVVERAREDDVVVVTRDGGLLPGLSKVSRSCPRVVSFYEAHDFNIDPSYRGRAKLKHYIQAWNERTYLPRLTGLLCITQAQQQLYRTALPRVASRTAPLGCLNFAERDPERRRSLRRIAYIGHLHGDKGINVLLRAAPALEERGVELWVFGGYDDQIKQHLGGLGCGRGSGAVRFFPFMSPRKLHRYLADEVSVGVVPLRDTFYNRYLTCPVKALDFLSHRLPIIATDLPSTHEILGEAGAFIPPDDDQRLVAAAAEILDSAERYRALSTASARRANALAWTNRAKLIDAWVSERRPGRSGAASKTGIEGARAVNGGAQPAAARLAPSVDVELSQARSRDIGARERV
jgi:glycosyltransferase involved in cell wall biosynthesis